MKRLKEFRQSNMTDRIVWDAIKNLEFFNFSDVKIAVSIPETKLRTILSRLNRQGYTRIHHSKGNRVFYTCQSNASEIEAQMSKRQTAEGAMWIAMRISKSFTVTDIFAGLAPSRPDVGLEDIITYSETLTSAGFLKMVRRAAPEGGRDVVYRLVNDTGPLPPKAQRGTVVIDQNTNTIAYAEGLDT
jgi:hypothetical protein